MPRVTHKSQKWGLSLLTQEGHLEKLDLGQDLAILETANSQKGKKVW